MNPDKVSELCKLTTYHIDCCRCSARLSPLKEPPYVPPSHQRNLATLACVMEVLVRSMDGVLFEDRTLDIDAINHSFEVAT